ncbi:MULTISPECIES: hypothetical protein [Haloarcula]|uniref:hypothetical protein n=1 Tax=Haloarcula TaxID=2237 RepID=UPI0023EDEF57|nr:hypothetical protein [Halomicroarcula sp. XH51]
MGRTRASTARGWTKRDLLGGLLLVPGLALAGVGSYLQFTIATRVSAGQCDGCASWHPLFVVAPLVVGAALVLLGSSLVYR